MHTTFLCAVNMPFFCAVWQLSVRSQATARWDSLVAERRWTESWTCAATSCRQSVKGSHGIFRKAGSFGLERGHVKAVAVVALFHAWLFNAGARRLGTEATWQEFLQLECQDADEKLASTFCLDDSVFSAADILKEFAEVHSQWQVKHVRKPINGFAKDYTCMVASSLAAGVRRSPQALRP